MCCSDAPGNFPSGWRVNSDVKVMIYMQTGYKYTVTSTSWFIMGVCGFSVCKMKCAVALSHESFISASVLQSVPLLPFLYVPLCETEVVLFEHKYSCGLCLNGLFCFCYCVFFSLFCLFTLPRGYACSQLEPIFISRFYIERPNILILN